MVKGIYSAANGLLVQSLRTDLIAGNLAGASVAGFRGEVARVASVPRSWTLAAAGAAGPGGATALLAPEGVVDLRPGALRATGGRLDLALEGPGFFCVRTASGEAYTRSGAFRLDAAGTLVTAAGDPVLGEAGPIRVSGSDVAVSGAGEVVVDGASVARLRLVDFPPGVAVIRLGQGLLGVASPANQLPRATEARVRQGYLEEANVDALRELAAMISALRAFEASQRAVQAHDETLATAISEVGRV